MERTIVNTTKTRAQMARERKAKKMRERIIGVASSIAAVCLSGALLLSSTTAAVASDTSSEDSLPTSSEITSTDTGTPTETELDAEGDGEDTSVTEAELETTPVQEVVENPEPTDPVGQPDPAQSTPTQQSPPSGVQRLAAPSQQAPVNYGIIGDLQPFSSDGNKASYWVSRIPNAIECYKYDGAAMANNSHAYLTNDGKTVVLKPYGSDWIGDQWVGLIVKASTWDAITINPTAGTYYAAFENKDISHYIVCKGNAPQQPKPTVTITGDKQCVAASGTYNVTWTVTITGNGSLNEVDLKAISHSPSGSLINGINGQVWFYEWLQHHANHGLPAFPPGGTFTFTQSNIPGTATAASVTIQYDFRDGPSGDPIGTVTLGGDCAPPPPTDVCKNIDDNQETAPDGTIVVGDKCYLVKTRLERGELEEGTADCTVGTVTLTRTVWTVKYYVTEDGREIEVSRTSDTERDSRVLNETEIEDCTPTTPESKVTFTEWEDEAWACGDANVTQNRTKTTTPWKWVYLGQGKFELQADTENAVTVPEQRTRPLESEEVASCPLGLGAVTSQCVDDVPYFAWSGLSLPEGFEPEEGATLSVTFVHPSDSSQNYTVDGLTIAEDGSFLWPGATDGAVKNWPGWIRDAEGNYSETDGNFRWTRAAEGITVLFQVNPEVQTTVVYPNASAICANPPEDTEVPTTVITTSSGTLPPTGLNLFQSIMIALAGALVIGLGAHLRWGRRRTV